MPPTLTDLGWDDQWAAAFEDAARRGLLPGRVVIEFNHLFRVCLEQGELESTVAGRLKHHAGSRSELPAVGDWVAVRVVPSHRRGAIVSVLPRRSRFSRKAAGAVTGEQIVAANVNVVFLVMGLDRDFSLRRLDRYLLLARESGAAPVILLTKPDLAPDLAAQRTDVISRAGGLPVHVLNPKQNEGLEPLGAYLQHGRTAALLGSSGVGKSSIINRLAGVDRQRIRDVRESDSRGRHTTTNRELVVLPGGGLIIDTPGMRELQLWDVFDAVQETFDDVEALAGQCRFTDCRHRGEPQCAVAEAVADGRVTAERLEAYHKLRDEITDVERQQQTRQQLAARRRSRLAGRASKPQAKAPRGRNR